MRELPSPAAMEALTASWRPYRSVGCYYMWRLSEAAPKASSPGKSKAGGGKKGASKAAAAVGEAGAVLPNDGAEAGNGPPAGRSKAGNGRGKKVEAALGAGAAAGAAREAAGVEAALKAPPQGRGKRVAMGNDETAASTAVAGNVDGALAEVVLQSLAKGVSVETESEVGTVPVSYGGCKG